MEHIKTTIFFNESGKLRVRLLCIAAHGTLQKG